MKRVLKNYKDISEETKQDISEKIDRYVNDFIQCTSDLEKFPSINELEEKLIELENETRNKFLHMASELLSCVNEKDMIASKKDIFEKRG